MKEINVLIAIIAFLVLLLGFLKNYIKRSILSEPLIALFIGILIGPQVLNWTDPQSWENSFEILHQSTRYTLALAIMAAALRLPSDYLQKNIKPYLVVLFGGMLLMAVISSAAYFILGFSFLESLLTGAILTPTDPVLATTIVSGSYANANIPAKLRNMITAESASNDGLAYFIVLLPLFLMNKELSVSSWFTNVVLWENLGAIILGALTGYLVGRAFRFFRTRDAMEPKTLLAITLSVTFLIVTSFRLIHMNGIIGIFAAGIVFQMLVGEKTEVRQERVQSMIERIFLVPVFVILGAMLPWQGWFEMPVIFWMAIPLTIIIRRLPTWFILKPGIKIFTKRDSLFAGWFGPVGVAAIFYITFIIINYPGHEHLWPIVSYAVITSTLLYAVSANPLSKHLYSEKEKK